MSSAARCCLFVIWVLLFFLSQYTLEVCLMLRTKTIGDANSRHSILTCFVGRETKSSVGCCSEFMNSPTFNDILVDFTIKVSKQSHFQSHFGALSFYWLLSVINLNISHHSPLRRIT